MPSLKLLMATSKAFGIGVGDVRVVDLECKPRGRRRGSEKDEMVEDVGIFHRRFVGGERSWLGMYTKRI